MTQVHTGSPLQTYFSMKIIKTPQYLKTSLYPDHPQGQINFSIEDDKDTKKLPQTKAFLVRLKIPSSIKTCTMYKLVHCLPKQFSILVSTLEQSLLKGISKQTLVSPLIPHY